MTGASGGLGQAIARALARRGAHVVLTARRAEVLEALAAETGGRALACDLSDRAALERLVERGRAGRRARRQRGHPGQRPDRLVHRRADRPRARRQPARPDGPRAADVRGHGRARRRPDRVRLLAQRQGGRGRRVGLRGDQVRPARLRPGPARGPAAARRRRLDRVPRLHPRRRDVRRRPAPSCRRTSGTKTPDDVGNAVVRAIERDRSEVDVAPLSMRLGVAFAGLAPEVAARVQRRLGASELAGAVRGAASATSASAAAISSRTPG